MEFPITDPSQNFILDRDLIIKDANDEVRIRLDHETGSIFIQNRNGELVGHLEMPGANLRLGGNGQDGDLVIFAGSATAISDANAAVFHLNSDSGVARLGGNQVNGRFVFKDATDEQTLFLDGGKGAITAGANGKDGSVSIQNADSQRMIFLDGSNANITAGGKGQDGDLLLRDGSGNTSIHLNSTGGDSGNHAIMRAGGDGTSGHLQLFTKDQDSGSPSPAVKLSSSTSSLSLGGFDQADGQLLINDHQGTMPIKLLAGDSSINVGGSGRDGQLRLLHNSQGEPATPVVFAHAGSGILRIGGRGDDGHGANGHIVLRNEFNQDNILLESRGANIRAGALGSDGDLVLYPGAGDSLTDTKQSSIHLSAGDGSARIGGGSHGIAGNVIVRNSEDQTTIHLDGAAGDIILHNADGAEDFEIAAGEDTTPGDVMSLDLEGKLCLSVKPYDTCVAGIVAGAEDLRPGIILGRRHDATNTVPIALFGRTYCKADATNSPIAVGDLLTTSSKPGFAMKATNPLEAFGAIIGKALKPLSDGTGLIPILVSLQ